MIITPCIPPWLQVAEGELGVSEVPGSGDNPRILEYHKYTALKATSDEVPWCSSFINFCVMKSGLEGTHSAAARSWLGWGVSLSVPAFGCVAVLKRGSLAWQAHVVLWIGEPDSKTIRGIGGNQGDKVSIENFSKSKVLGYRWPGP
jgi:uncharacterized protein (TIGR02594 family)